MTRGAYYTVGYFEPLEWLRFSGLNVTTTNHQDEQVTYFALDIVYANGMAGPGKLKVELDGVMRPETWTMWPTGSWTAFSKTDAIHSLPMGLGLHSVRFFFPVPYYRLLSFSFVALHPGGNAKPGTGGTAKVSSSGTVTIAVAVVVVLIVGIVVVCGIRALYKRKPRENTGKKGRNLELYKRQTLAQHHDGPSSPTKRIIQEGKQRDGILDDTKPLRPGTEMQEFQQGTGGATGVQVGSSGTTLRRRRRSEEGDSSTGEVSSPTIPLHRPARRKCETEQLSPSTISRTLGTRGGGCFKPGTISSTEQKTSDQNAVLLARDDMALPKVERQQQPPEAQGKVRPGGEGPKAAREDHAERAAADADGSDGGAGSPLPGLDGVDHSAHICTFQCRRGEIF